MKARASAQTTTTAAVPSGRSLPTLARALQLQLLLELGFYAAIGWVLLRVFAWGLADVMALAVAIFVALRLTLVAFTFVVAWRYRTPRLPEHRLGLGASIKLFLAEAWAFIALFAFVQPFERVVMRPDRLRRVRRDEHPVLLVHGYLCNRGAWRRLRSRLERRGYCVATLNLEPALADIDNYVDQLQRRSDEVLCETGADKLDVVAHSMGGLVVRAGLARGLGSRIRRLITLGTPHQGSVLAACALGENCRQMRQASPWQQRLAVFGLSDCAVTSIYSRHDNFVMPQANQELRAADNVPLLGIGHLALLSSSQVAAIVERVLSARTLTSESAPPRRDAGSRDRR